VELERDAANGLYNAKVSARAMKRAMRNENVLRRPGPTQILEWGEWAERRGRTMERTWDGERRNVETERRSDYCLGSLAQTDAEGSRGGTRQHCQPTAGRERTSIVYPGKQDLASLPPATNFNSKRISSKEPPNFTRFSSLRHTDEAALRFRAIQNADERTQKMILEGQIDRIAKAVMPPLQAGPGRDVEFVVRTGRRDREEVGRMGEVGAEVEMEMDNEGGGNRRKEWRWGKVVGRIRGFCARRSGRREVRGLEMFGLGVI
jgi:hypothetical protein